jgi:hypothetical protein
MGFVYRQRAVASRVCTAELAGAPHLIEVSIATTPNYTVIRVIKDNLVSLIMSHHHHLELTDLQLEEQRHIYRTAVVAVAAACLPFILKFV